MIGKGFEFGLGLALAYVALIVVGSMLVGFMMFLGGIGSRSDQDIEADRDELTRKLTWVFEHRLLGYKKSLFNRSLAAEQQSIRALLERNPDFHSKIENMCSVAYYQATRNVERIGFGTPQGCPWTVDEIIGSRPMAP